MCAFNVIPDQRAAGERRSGNQLICAREARLQKILMPRRRAALDSRFRGNDVSGGVL